MSPYNAKPHSMDFFTEVTIEPHVWDKLPVILRDFFGRLGGFQLERHVSVVTLRFADPLECALLLLTFCRQQPSLIFDVIVMEKSV